MIKKDKTFELRIEEDDEISGIDSVSLVSDPAIEINWVAFSKHKEQEDFQIPDGEDDRYVQMLMAKGHPEEDLITQGYSIESIEYIGKEGFATKPNATSEWDTEEYQIRYKYALNPNIKESSIISTTRDFCKHLVNKNYVWRIEEMDSLVNDFGNPAIVWRGGFNCRHMWSKIKYKKDATIVNKASVNKGKIIGDTPGPMETDVIGYDQPSTVTTKTLNNPSPSTVRNLGLAKQFQDECPEAITDIAVNLKNRQRAIDIAHYGPLNPNESNEDYWKAKAKMFGGDTESAKKALCGNCAFFVQTQKMLDCIASGINDVNEWDTIDAGDLGYCEAFDFKCAASRTCDAWVVGGPITDEDMGYDVGGLPAYVDQVSGKTIGKSIAFESYSDYPDSVKNNAKAVLKYAEENGWGSCGTGVGKIRANQLANGEPISEDTIRRMYSYLSRHAGDLDSSKGYGDGCGKLMYDAWGGKSALSWAESKINTFEKQKMAKQIFATDESQRSIVGVAMVPDKKIFRKDDNGDPYWVVFKEDTIKMIAEKYMRNKYLDNNDLEHNGKAVRDVYVVESWIKEDEQDKSNKYGFEGVPVGSWFIKMKCAKTPEGDVVWEKIKSGELRGFSVSGWFSEELASFYKEEIFLQKVAEIISRIEED